jgi:hypothetical protein
MHPFGEKCLIVPYFKENAGGKEEYGNSIGGRLEAIRVFPKNP